MKRGDREIGEKLEVQLRSQTKRPDKWQRIWIESKDAREKIEYYECNHSVYMQCPKESGCTKIDQCSYEYIIEHKISDESFKCSREDIHDGPANSLRDSYVDYVSKKKE